MFDGFAINLGCGKSTLPSFLAQQYHYYYLPIQLTDLIQGEIGSSEKRIQQLFQEAKQKAPCIVFIDEFDCLFSSEGSDSSSGGHSSQHSTVISTLLNGIDDITSWNQYASTQMVSTESKKNNDMLSTAAGNHHVLVMIASREPWCIDPRFLQPNRISEKLHLSTMSVDGKKELVVDEMKNILNYINALEERKEVFDIIPQFGRLNEENDPINHILIEFTSKLEGYTGAELKFLFKKILNTVQKCWTRRKDKEGHKLDLWKDCIYNVSNQMRPLLSKEHIQPYMIWQQDFS
jgi:SpoVK/Ycf46/Vps4 family AAA+-type ATPase